MKMNLLTPFVIFGMENPIVGQHPLELPLSLLHLYYLHLNLNLHQIGKLMLLEMGLGIRLDGNITEVENAEDAGCIPLRLQP